MKRIFQLCFSLAIFSVGFSQNLKPVAQKVKNSQTAKKTFVKYNLFKTDASPQKMAQYRAAAEDITVLQLNKSEVQRVNSEKPDAMEMSFPFEGKTITLELVRNYILTNDFAVTTEKGAANYTPGVYYQGIVKGDNESLVAVSFFHDEVMGVTSIKDVGNIILGKTKNSEDYVSYNDQKLKGTNPFTCGADDLPENQNAGISYDPNMASKALLTDNCVRIYYEVGYGPYQQNGSNVTTATNWVTAMHNNISTLYANDGVNVALSSVMVWTTTDPYSGAPDVILGQFRSTRTTFNGDLAQLLRNPATTSIAYLNTLCTNSNYSYCGVNFGYSNVPTYSWNIEAMTHEMGHNLGSPHTHACKWNGNNTAIDGCGPASGNNEGCNGPLPTGTGGTIMSYCHLVGSVGINFANGFGPQPGALIRSRINVSGCLGTDCVSSCAQTISGFAVSNITSNSATATITDPSGTSWRYTLTKGDGTLLENKIVTNKVINLTNLQPGTFYFIAVSAPCTGPEAYASRQIIYTDADWCSGVLVTDSGGENANYSDGESWSKTYYPNNPNDKLKITFTEFDTEPSSDYLIIYDGPNFGSPRFGTTWSGTTIPGPFTSTHATGAITLRFISNATINKPGWKANLECMTLGTGENTFAAGVNIAQTSSKGVFIIVSKDKLLSYQVFDASGKIVKNSSKIAAAQEKLDLSNYPAGTYLVTVSTEKETVTKKIIK
ncbi:M12 family metallo-peptidase [Chryseobacterium koreense]|uniref:M12 family metallo-peptidase n=1 Tax=Chryseobacterium koreense TaxID=232216 RepID=UPI0026EAA73F|nr:M12 family metallo-peptidase [Chryseobacterium koreense]